MKKLGLLVGLIAVTGLPAACGGDADNESAPAADTSTPGTATGSAREVARADFVLCPAIEGIAEELAQTAGFEMDLERGVQELVGECFIRGEAAEFVSVALAPAIMSSVSMQASGYEGNQAAAPALGADAVMIQDPLQPHVVFPLLGQIIDVGVELSGGSTPSTSSVMAVAAAVRDALLAANGG